PTVQGKVNGLHLLGDRVYVTTDTNQMYGLNQASGLVSFGVRTAPADEPTRAPVLVAGNLAVARTNSIGLYDLSGNLVRDITLGRPIRSAPAVQRNTLLLGVDAPNGGGLATGGFTPQHVPILSEMTTGTITSRPAVLGDLIFAASLNGRVWACDDERMQVWNLPGGYFSTDKAITADLVVDEYGVYVAGEDTKLYVLDRLNGRLRWTYFAGVALTNTPVVTAETVYLRVPGKGMVAITKTGEQKFRTPKWVNASVRQVVSFDDRHVYAVRNDNALVALDKETGQEKFASERRDLTIFATNQQSPIIYAATEAGEIIAVRPVLRAGTSGQLVLAPIDAGEPIAMR
ncbi:MAG TPA: PQQ-binding-like beta-propeller repeat protein, partial [Tepidisphaeraceae bacterium]|nr:PQQ-binding-like beta-propeller repeat protein [Tepidisphaeraceae bacterium]